MPKPTKVFLIQVIRTRVDSGVELPWTWVHYMEEFLEQAELGELFDGTPCFLWTGDHSKGGYGRVTIDEERYYIHRVSYEEFAGETAKSVHHRCEVVSCFNPLHLENLSHGEHQRHHLGRDTCLRGHSKKIGEECQECKRFRRKRYYEQHGQ